MPVFEIVLDDGRKLRVDADDQQAALAGVEQFKTQQPKKAAAEKSTSPIDAVLQGGADVVGGLGETAEQYLGKGAISDGLKGAAATMAPENYQRSRLYTSKDGVNVGDVPNAIAEALPGLAGTATAYRVGSKAGGWKGGALAAALTSLGLSAGNEAKRSADARTGEEGTTPETQDKARALAYGIPGAALDALGAGRLVSGALKSVGAAGVGAAAKNYGTKIATEAATEAGQETLAQGGSTVGTKDGMRFKPEDIADNALRGGFTSATYAAPRAVKETSTAARLAKFGGDNAETSTAVANDLMSAADGDLGGIGGTQRAAKAFKDVSGNYHGELAATVKAARAAGTLPEDQAFDNAITRSSKGDALNAEDRRALDNAPSEVKALARKITILADLKKSNLGTEDNFKGGLSARAESSIRALVNSWGVGAGVGLGLMGLGGANAAVMGSQSAPAVAAIGAGYLGTRAIDRFTGSRNPLERFAKQFADGQAPQRAAPAQTAPVDDGPVPWGPWNMPPPPQVGAFGKGARPPEPGPQEAAPWGPWNPPPAPQVGAFGKGPRPPEQGAPPPPQFDPRSPEMRDALKGLALRMKMRDEQAAREAEANRPPPEEPGVDYAALGERMRMRAKLQAVEERRQAAADKAAAREQAAAAKAAARAPVVDDGSEIPAFLPNRQDIPAFLPNRGQQAALAPQGAPVDAAPPVGMSPVDVPAFLPPRSPEAPPPPPVTKVTKVDGKVNVNSKTAAQRALKKLAAPVQEQDAVEESVSPAPAPVQEQAKGPYVPDATKTAFKTVEGDEAFPFHDKWDMTPREAAEAIAAQQGDKPWITEGWVSGVARRIEAKHTLTDAIVAAAPKLKRDKVLSQLLVVDSVPKAEAYRTHLLTQVKSVKAKAALMTAFSNEAIASAWKRSRKK